MLTYVFPATDEDSKQENGKCPTPTLANMNSPKSWLQSHRNDSKDKEISEPSSKDEETSKTPSKDKETSKTPSKDEVTSRTPLKNKEISKTPLKDQEISGKDRDCQRRDCHKKVSE